MKIWSKNTTIMQKWHYLVFQLIAWAERQQKASRWPVCGLFIYWLQESRYFIRIPERQKQNSK